MKIKRHFTIMTVFVFYSYYIGNIIQIIGITHIQLNLIRVMNLRLKIGIKIMIPFLPSSLKISWVEFQQFLNNKIQ